MEYLNSEEKSSAIRKKSSRFNEVTFDPDPDSEKKNYNFSFKTSPRHSAGKNSVYSFNNKKQQEGDIQIDSRQGEIQPDPIMEESLESFIENNITMFDAPKIISS
jgi:hypothetical protein